MVRVSDLRCVVGPGWRSRAGIMALFTLLCSFQGESIAQTGKSWPRAADGAPLLKGSYNPNPPASTELRILTWNIERGLQLEVILEFIASERPNLCFLQEVDVNAKRTGRLNIGDCLAQTLGMNYVWGCEFEELGQENKNGPAYHGQAILTNLAVCSTKILRFKHQSGFWYPHWYVPNWSWFQRRVGGRMALVAELKANRSLLVVYDVHLESRDSETLRLQQLEEVLADIEQIPSDTPVIIAGDFNSKKRPSSLAARLRQSGFRDAVNCPDIATSMKGSAIDWIFMRGHLQAVESGIHKEIRASDHFPVTVTVFRQ